MSHTRILLALGLCFGLVGSSYGLTDDEVTALTELPPELPWSGKSESLILDADHDWVTPAELSGFRSTPSYEETTQWLKRLVAASPLLELHSIGKSPQGRDIWMVIASIDDHFDPNSVHAAGKSVVLAQAGIHPGEIDGKDAGMMFLRDISVRGKHTELLDKASLLFVPILSVDGHENTGPYNRINQRGPENMGWRANANNLNLNRDYAKLDTAELRAVVNVINHWKPHLYLDIHVTDGADYQYDITYGFNGQGPWSPSIKAWLNGAYRQQVDGMLSDWGHIPGPLIFAMNGQDMSAGIFDWTATPRFSDAWGDARHLPTVLVENHSLKPYRQRVLGTYVYLLASLQAAVAQGDTLREVIAEDRARNSERVVLNMGMDDPPKTTPLAFKGVVSERYASQVSGREEVRWRGKPIEQEVMLVSPSKITGEVRRPHFYYLPVQWSDVAERLQLQGILMERLEADLTLEVMVYRLPEMELQTQGRSASPYEGRMRFTPGEIVRERREVSLPAGSWRISAHQPLGDLLVLLLEPESPDSLFQWGFFASIMNRTEYIESYVVEPLARRMLAADPELKAEYAAWLSEDEDLSASASNRLAWFYARTPYIDPHWKVYPVYRSVD